MKLNEPVISSGTVNRKGIYFFTDKNGKILKFKPWLADIFSFLYDRIMEKSIFPKLLNSNMNKHIALLKTEFRDLHQLNILEIGTGSGTSADVIPADNRYTGIDISSGLLKKAFSRFQKAGFENFKLFVTSAEILPFEENTFDYAICNLSLNFFDDIPKFVNELKKVLKPDAVFFCSVPIPERKSEKSNIHGTLFSERELSELFATHGFSFQSKPAENGAILYFTAQKK